MPALARRVSRSSPPAELADERLVREEPSGQVPPASTRSIPDSAAPLRERHRHNLDTANQPPPCAQPNDQDQRLNIMNTVRKSPTNNNKPRQRETIATGRACPPGTCRPRARLTLPKMMPNKAPSGTSSITRPTGNCWRRGVKSNPSDSTPRLEHSAAACASCAALAAPPASRREHPGQRCAPSGTSPPQLGHCKPATPWLRQAASVDQAVPGSARQRS